MNLWKKIASTLAVVAGLAAGQTAQTGTKVPIAPSSASVNPPASSEATPAASQPPDLSFKPNPLDETVAPAPVVVPAVPPAENAPGPESATPASVAPAPVPESAPVAQPNKAPQGSGATAKPPADDAPRYVLGANDVVSVGVFDEKNVSGTYSIGPDGRMSVPLIGDFKAAGLTLPKLEELLTQKLSDYIVGPVVNVQLLRNNSKKYTLVGGVLKPGPFPLLQETTILDALAAAGGMKEFANEKRIVRRRGTKEFTFNYKDVTHGKHMEQNIKIEDGDIIFIPE
jgi:polysaccharide export outer membrane protein